MTPQHPHFKEYHHSDDEFNNLVKEFDNQRNRLFKILPSGKCDNKCDNCILCDNTGGCFLDNTRNDSECERVLDEAIEHYERVIREEKGVTFNHSIDYQWMYGGVVKYLKQLRQQQDAQR